MHSHLGLQLSKNPDITMMCTSQLPTSKYHYGEKKLCFVDDESVVESDSLRCILLLDLTMDLIAEIIMPKTYKP